MNLSCGRSRSRARRCAARPHTEPRSGRKGAAAHHRAGIRPAEDAAVPAARCQAEAAVTLPPRRKEYLIVDGYNMIFAWDGLREQAAYDLSGARERLLDLLSNYCGFHPCELIVVFDSYRVRGGHRLPQQPQ